MQTAHDDTARTTGRAYLYFWPGGLTERAAIQIRIGDSEDGLADADAARRPAHGQGDRQGGPGRTLQLPTDDAHASDRQDTGL